MYFECMEVFKSEDGYRFEGRHMKLEFGSIAQKNNYNSFDEDHFWKGSPNWYNLVEEYSARRLTIPSDKLPALSGLAERFKEAATHDEYVAGIWKEALLEGLCWRRVGPSKPFSTSTASRAPSWSWSSNDGYVVFRGVQGEPSPEQLCMGYRKWNCLATVLDYKITIKGENPFGEIESAYLKLEAPIEPALLSKEPDRGPHFRISFAGCSSGQEYPGFDLEPEDSDELLQLNLYALFLFSKKPRGAYDDSMRYIALLVTPVEGQAAYRRIGIIESTAENAHKWEWAHRESHPLPVTVFI
jgi:hypothetical protein